MSNVKLNRPIPGATLAEKVFNLLDVLKGDMGCELT